MGFLGGKLLESDDKQFICYHLTSFLPLKAFGTFGYKSIKNYFFMDSSTTVGMTEYYFTPVVPKPPRSASPILSTSSNSGFSIFTNIPCPIRSPFSIVTSSLRILI